MAGPYAYSGLQNALTALHAALAKSTDPNASEAAQVEGTVELVGAVKQLNSEAQDYLARTERRLKALEEAMGSLQRGPKGPGPTTSGN